MSGQKETRSTPIDRKAQLDRKAVFDSPVRKGVEGVTGVTPTPREWQRPTLISQIMFGLLGGVVNEGV